MRSDAPPRLRSDVTTPRILRAALGAESDEPSHTDLEALGARLGIGLIPVPPPPAPAAVGVLGIAKAKLVSGILVPALIGALAATVVIKVTRPALPASTSTSAPLRPVPSRPETRETPPPTSPVSSPAPLPTSAASHRDVSADPPPHVRPLPIDPRAAAPREAPLPEESIPPPSRPMIPETEAALLERAKSLVDSDPATALSIATEHASRFPKGMLGQEAEVIAIEALVRSRRTTEAGDRLTHFRSSFPSSAYLPHLESIVRHSR